MGENLLEKLKKYGASDYYPLHMPGHKRNTVHFTDPFSIDITEIDGFDNLFHAEEILLEAQQRAAQLYHSDETFYLVNGSTCGLLSAISASVPRGGRILMSRNSHKASYHAAFLNGLHVTYLYPEADMMRGINGSIRPEQVREALLQHPDIRAVLITSPTYDGVVSDIKAIAELTHRAGAVLIVDEAHGAHFAMHDFFPKSALALGADLVINSIHKTLPSMTQTALLHVQGERVDRRRLKKYLGIYQSSSPSYVLMAGMDACICLMAEQGQELFDCFIDRLEKMRASLGQMKYLHLVTGTEAELYAFDFDRSKVLISTEKTTWTGPKLSEVLRREFHLEAEMEAERYVTAIMTVADTQEGFDRLERALLEVDARIEAEQRAQNILESETEQRAQNIPESETEQRVEDSPHFGRTDNQLYFQNEEVLTIEEAESSTHERVPLMKSGGRISGEFVYLYPPGIPLIVPGERIPKELPEQLLHYRSIGLNLQGLEDYAAEWIRVVED